MINDMKGLEPALIKTDLWNNDIYNINPNVKPNTKLIDMNKQQAIEALHQGHKLTHRLFTKNEWVCLDKDGSIKTEDGYNVRWDVFWNDRLGKFWESDWEIKTN